MNLLNKIFEVWDRTVTSPLSRSLEIEIYKNPARSEFAKLMKQHRELRGLLDPNGDLYVWDAYVATHADVEPHYNADYRQVAYLILFPDKVWMNDLNYFYSLENGPDKYAASVRSMWEMVINNRSLKHIYGDFLPIGVDNDHGRFHTLMTPQWIEQNVDK